MNRNSRSTASNEVRDVLDSIRRIVRLLRVSSRESEREVGLSSAQLFVIQKLHEADVLSVNELAERTHTHQSSVSVVVQALVDKKLVTRRRAADDARRMDVALTSAARARLKKAPNAAQDRIIEAIENLPGAVRTQLAQSLTRLVQEANLDEEDAPMMFEDGNGSGKAKKSSRGKSRGRVKANAPR